MENFNQELLQKARKANSSEELLDIGRENGVELTKEDAEVYFEELHQSRKLSDEELDNVAGGGCNNDSGYKKGQMCPKCHSTKITNASANSAYCYHCTNCNSDFTLKPSRFSKVSIK